MCNLRFFTFFLGLPDFFLIYKVLFKFRHEGSGVVYRGGLPWRLHLQTSIGFQSGQHVSHSLTIYLYNSMSSYVASITGHHVIIYDVKTGKRQLIINGDSQFCGLKWQDENTVKYFNWICIYRFLVDYYFFQGVSQFVGFEGGRLGFTVQFWVWWYFCLDLQYWRIGVCCCIIKGEESSGVAFGFGQRKHGALRQIASHDSTTSGSLSMWKFCFVLQWT